MRTLPVNPFYLTPVQTFEGAILLQLVTFSLIFYQLYMIRYMRLKLVTTESVLMPLSPQGEETLHKAFGRVSNTRPIVLMTVAPLIVVLVVSFPGLQRSQGLSYTLYTVASYVMFSLTIGPFIWVYIASLWGLHTFGKEPLKLKPLHEDPMLGVRPTGSLSLSLVSVFFGGTIVSTVAQIISPSPSYIPTSIWFTVLGAAMFFLPLNSIHRRMQQEKQREQASVRSQFNALTDASNNPHLDGPESVLIPLKTLVTFEVLKLNERRVSAMPTWPFDTRILSRFAAIILSVITIILARIITITLHL